MLTDSPHVDDYSADSKCQKDEQYFLESNILVTFQVEGSLFRVPKQMFQESEVFVGMWTLPQVEDDKRVEGSSAENPIVLPAEIGAHDFKQLLRLLYPNDLKLMLWKPPKFKVDDLIAILRLSTQWLFFDARRYAIKNLSWHIKKENLPLVKMVIAGRLGVVVKWVEKAYIRFVERADPLSDAEAEVIGWRTAMALQRVRERFWKAKAALVLPKVGAKGSLPKDFVRSDVKETFVEELKRIRLSEAVYGPKTTKAQETQVS